MRRTNSLALALVLLLLATTARAQETGAPKMKDGWTVGVSGGAGVPSSLGSIRFGAPLSPNVGIDLAVARLTGYGGTTRVGPAYISQVRWMRGGRKASGDSRYWIFGVLGMNARSSAPVIYCSGDVRQYPCSGDVREYRVENTAIVMPRVGYGWDHVTRRGARFGAELTTGAAGENGGLMLANVFIMWGPPR